MTDEIVTRLYRELVDALQRRGHPEDQPLKVADLYQEVVPYRAVRSRLGVELNADYEHALLRLLAGERGLLRVEPAEAREELQEEAAAPYPDVDAFRRFSGSDVWVSLPDGVLPEDQLEEQPERQESASSDEGQASQPTDIEELRAGSARAVARAPIRLHTDEAEEVEEDPRDRRRPLAGRTCAFCTERLPERRRVRFCPYCGGDQRLNPCPRCDAVLEQGWRYCISCGYEVDD